MVRIAIIFLCSFLFVAPVGGKKSARSELDELADKAGDDPKNVEDQQNDKELKNSENSASKSSEIKTEEADKSLARGFGNDIDWVSMSNALQIADEKKKPIFVMVHGKWCAASQALKPKFSTSSAIKELSKNFVMVNMEDDEEPQGENGEEFKFGPDGGYVPRIVFLKHNGELMKEITNPDDKYNANKYYYPTPDLIIKSMETAIAKAGTGIREKDEL